MKKTVVFDFDKTLTYKDTVFGFFWAASKPGSIKHFKAAVYWLGVIAAKFGLMSLDQVKSMGVRLFLSHHSVATLEAASSKYASTIQLNRLYALFESALPDAWVVSASLECYLKALIKCKNVVGATLAFDDRGRPTGIGKSCSGAEKVARLNAIGITSIDEFYTDSKSDAPLAAISKRVYLVKGDSFEEVEKL